MKTTYIALILATLAAGPAMANSGGYQTHSAYTYGPSHNNYNGKAPTTGASTDNYNGHQTYGSAPKTGSPVVYGTSKRSLSNSVPY